MSLDDAGRHSVEVVASVGEELDLDRYSVVGSYRRFSFEVRSLMGVWWESIHAGLAAPSRQRQNFLLWGKPGEGKTRFVTEAAKSLNNRIDQFNFTSFNCAKDSTEQFEVLRQKLRDGPLVPTLCFFDEIDDPAATVFYGRMLELLELNERPDRHVVFVLAGSGYGSSEDMVSELRSRDKGTDAVSRVPAANRVTVPAMDLGDRLLVFVSVTMATKTGEPVSAFEQFGIYSVLCREELDTPREVTVVAQQAASRMRPTETVLRYGHLFDAAEEARRFNFLRDHQEAVHALPGAISVYMAADARPPESVERKPLSSDRTVDPDSAKGILIPPNGSAPMALPSGTVTLLMTDIEGSTRLWERHREQMDVALRRHDQIMRQAIEDAGGYVFKTVGDSFCAAFTTAREAALAASNVRRSLASERWPEPIEIRVRMALHTGKCEERDGDYFGPTVNRTARLEAVAHGGQIVVSQVAAELMREMLPEQCFLRDLGEHRLKDLGRPEHVFELVSEGSSEPFPPLRSLDSPELYNNLPVQLTSFVGRIRERGEVRALVGDWSLVTLTGPGGSGKTRLALQTAAELLDGSGDGVWFIDLAPLSDPDLVAETVAVAIGLREEPGRPISETLLEALGGRELLLLLDNCEHLIDSVAKFADSILRSCPRVRLLATSREALGIAGETVYRVPTLSLPVGPTEDLDQRAAVSSEAVQLFVSRAADARTGFVLDEATRPYVVSICRRLDGIPLAIELAAARLVSMSVADIDTRLGDRFRLLTGGARTAASRQRTLRGAIDWSYESLTFRDRSVMNQLSVFAGGFDLQAAEAVCASEDVELFDVTEAAISLVEKSLVQTEMAGPLVRYRLLETIREYASDRLDEDPVARDRATQAHAEYFLELARSSDMHERHSAWLALLEADHENLVAAFDTLVAADRTREALELTSSLRRFWIADGYYQEGAALLEVALGMGSSSPPTPLYGRALVASAILVGARGDVSQARRRLSEARQVADDRRDRPLLTDVLCETAWLDFQQGDSASALMVADTAISEARDIGDANLLGFALSIRGSALFPLDIPLARMAFEEALACFRATGDDERLSRTLCRLAIHELEIGDRQTAERLLANVLEISSGLHNRGLFPHVYAALGLSAMLDSNRGLAKARFTDGLKIARQLGEGRVVAYSTFGLAWCATADSPEDAASLYGAADALLDYHGELLEDTELALRERDHEILRQRLGEDVFRTQYSLGRALGSEEAVAVAMRYAAVKSPE